MESPLQLSLCSLGWFFFLRRAMSDSGKFDELEKRKRTETINLAVSVFHSFFSGLGALIAIWKMVRDTFTEILAIFSVKK
jgi:hypothetical protein